LIGKSNFDETFFKMQVISEAFMLTMSGI
jgi:hypothetical protein